MKKFLFFAVIGLPAILYAQPKDTLHLLQLHAPDTFCVQMVTSKGSMIIRINRSWSPLGADRFYQLVTSHYYDNSRLFRSNRKYLQFGISNDSAVNVFWDRHAINDEQLIQKNTAGTISFAMGGPNSRSASVYFNKVDNPKLDTIQHGTGFPGFGTIIEGDSLLAVFENKYEDSVVFKEWDSMMVKGNAYTDRVLPRLDYIISMSLTECGPFYNKEAFRKDETQEPQNRTR